LVKDFQVGLILIFTKVKIPKIYLTTKIKP